MEGVTAILIEHESTRVHEKTLAVIDRTNGSFLHVAVLEFDPLEVIIVQKQTQCQQAGPDLTRALYRPCPHHQIHHDQRYTAQSNERPAAQ